MNVTSFTKSQDSSKLNDKKLSFQQMLKFSQIKTLYFTWMVYRNSNTELKQIHQVLFAGIKKKKQMF